MNLVVTLAERDFFYGACTLFNSLVKHGFDGTFLVGCRKMSDVPGFLKSSISQFSDEHANCDGPCLKFIHVDTTWHFANYKPLFMRQVLDAYPTCSTIYYLDPDIVVAAPWRWFEESAKGGPVVAADVNWCMPSTHPTRRQWISLIHEAGDKCNNNFSLYFNSGMLGLHRKDQRFLELWHNYTVMFGSIKNPLDGKGDIGVWRQGGRWDVIHSPNQDTLNMAAMAWPTSLVTFGPDLMGFLNGWIALPHAIGSAKPWRRKYLREALAGKPPRLVDKIFWDHASSPIRVYTTFKIRRMKLTILLASFLGRFYRSI
jgi:hypothetical protein